MAFTDWDFYTQGVTSPSIGIDTSSNLVGVGSLRVSGTGTGAWSGHLDNSFAKGFTSGRIRTVFRKKGANGLVHFVLYFMASQLDITNGGSCYFLKMTHGSSAFTVQKSTSGGLQGSSTTLATYTNTTNGMRYANANEPCTVEVVWFGGPSAVAVFGGTRIQVRCMQGTSNFNQMASLPVVTDTTSPLMTSVAEGIGGFTTNGGVDPLLDFVDETTIYERVLI